MLPDTPRGRHGGEYFPQPVNQATLLINTEEWIGQNFADAIKQTSQLLRTAHVAGKDDDSTRLDFLDERTGFRVELRAGQADGE
jgi:hypothetical protein